MQTPEFFDSNLFTYFVLPFLIFLSRILDVSLDTIRIVFISKGNKKLAPFLGFFQVLIWIIAITRIMQNLDNFTCYIAYAAGFSVGNYLGLIIEEKLAIGIQLIRIITHKDASLLIEDLQSKGYSTTVVPAQGKKGLVHIIFLLTKRSNIPAVIKTIDVFNPKAFYSVEDVRAVNVNNEIFQVVEKKGIFSFLNRTAKK